MSGVTGLRVDVSRLLARGGREEVSAREPLPPLDLHGGEVRFDEPARVRAELRAVPDGIWVRVQAEAVGTARCDRCLGPVRVPLRVGYEERYVTPDRAAEAGEASEPDVRRAVLQGESVDLSEGLRQNLLLALPWKLLCREDCRGLCPRCGQNRNERECGCRPDAPGGRLEALRPLLERLVREQGPERN